MTDASLKQKIYDILKRGFFQDATDFVDVSDGPADDIHVVVVSRKLDGRRMKEKHDIIWAELTSALRPKEWNQVSLTVGVSPEDVKAVY